MVAVMETCVEGRRCRILGLPPGTCGLLIWIWIAISTTNDCGIAGSSGLASGGPGFDSGSGCETSSAIMAIDGCAWIPVDPGLSSG